MKIENSVAIVGGGASGLGAATVKRLLDKGAFVFALDLNEDALSALKTQINSDGLGTLVCDVTDESSVQAAVKKAAEKGPLRILVNCAGIAHGEKTVGRQSKPHALESFQKVIQINLVGSFNLVRLVAAEMSKNAPLDSNERGVVIQTASIAAFEGQMGQAAYTASKGAIASMTLPMARDLASVGVRVLTIAPGTFETPMLQGLPEKVKQGLAANIPHPNRLGSPDEYAHLAEHMIENAFLNGEVVRIDGALRLTAR